MISVYLLLDFVFLFKFYVINEKSPDFRRRTGLMKGGVVPPGIEPGTQGFSVLCSTN